MRVSSAKRTSNAADMSIPSGLSRPPPNPSIKEDWDEEDDEDNPDHEGNATIRAKKPRHTSTDPEKEEKQRSPSNRGSFGRTPVAKGGGGGGCCTIM